MSYTRKELLAMGLEDPCPPSQGEDATEALKAKLQEATEKAVGKLEHPLAHSKFALVPSSPEDIATIERWVGENFDGVCFCHHPDRALLDCVSCLQELARAVARSSAVIEGPQYKTWNSWESISIEEKIARTKAAICEIGAYAGPIAKQMLLNKKLLLAELEKTKRKTDP